jgi:hypothetical protein
MAGLTLLVLYDGRVGVLRRVAVALDAGVETSYRRAGTGNKEGGRCGTAFYGSEVVLLEVAEGSFAELQLV